MDGLELDVGQALTLFSSSYSKITFSLLLHSKVYFPLESTHTHTHTPTQPSPVQSGEINDSLRIIF